MLAKGALGEEQLYIQKIIEDYKDKHDKNMSILGLSRRNKNWHVRNSYRYVVTATKIRFHFQFPRSPHAAFGGIIGWLFNWKCRFSKIANYLKYNYFWHCDSIENVTLRLWKFSDFCSRHIVGVAGDDIMFHILVHNGFALLLCMCAYISVCCHHNLSKPKKTSLADMW